MNMLKKIIMMITAVAGVIALPAYGLVPLSDDGLAAVTGRSLFTATYLQPGGSGAGFDAGNPNQNIGFYRLGVEASMAINANIDKLRLGCDGAAGTGVCDISIDHLRLTGVAGTDVMNTAPPTDFVLNQPFFEFAIKNPNNAATRQVVGIRFGALSALGAMTIGENPNPSTLGEAGEMGINTLSGDMIAHITNAVMTNVCQGSFTSSGNCAGLAGLSGTATVSSYTQALVLNRTVTIADMGPMVAVSSIAGLTLSNTHIQNEPLIAIHRILVSNDAAGTVPTSDFYLSMQAQNINWQKLSTASYAGTIAAQQGWWMSIPEVQMPNISSNAQVAVSLGAIFGGLFGGQVNIPGIDLSQKPASNCWGSTNFC